MHSGTPNISAIVIFGEACRIAMSDGLSDAPRQRLLRDAFEKQLELKNTHGYKHLQKNGIIRNETTEKRIF